MAKSLRNIAKLHICIRSRNSRHPHFPPISHAFSIFFWSPYSCSWWYQHVWGWSQLTHISQVVPKPPSDLLGIDLTEPCYHIDMLTRMYVNAFRYLEVFRRWHFGPNRCRWCSSEIQSISYFHIVPFNGFTTWGALVSGVELRWFNRYHLGDCRRCRWRWLGTELSHGPALMTGSCRGCVSCVGLM